MNINSSTKELKKNGILLNAVITDIKPAYRGSPSYEYRFSFGGKFHSEVDAVGIKKLNSFIGKSFPIIFSPKTENSELLMTSEDFKKFDINFPDSLMWIMKFRNN